jgi:mRNA-degrading endonuclease toxin of MazEF toxin-antitoxin module
MARVRVSTTFDSDLLSRARETLAGSNDRRCSTRLARHRAAGVDLPTPRRSATSPARSGSDPADDPIPRRTAVNLDSFESVSITVLVERLGRLSDTRMRDLCTALEVAVGCTA